MSDAMTGLATGAHGNIRPQDILTPQNVVDFVSAMFGNEEIALDPCATRDDRGLVDALVEYRGAPTHIDGLHAPWMDRTYCNPPYADLKDWLRKAKDEAEELFRIAVLAPTRGNRTWFHEVRDTCQLCVELGPVMFVGYEKGTLNPRGEVRKANEHFPSPLSLLFWNVSPNIDEVVDAARAAKLPITKIAFPCV